MLTIRLQRVGKTNKAHFRLVLAEKAMAVKKQVTEVLGSYNPHSKELTIRDQARLDYWINEQHVGLSATAQNLLVSKELIKMEKTKAFTIPKKEVVEPEVAEPEAKEESKAEQSTDSSDATDETPEPAESNNAEASADTDTEAKPEDSAAEAPAEQPVEDSKDEAPESSAEPEKSE